MSKREKPLWLIGGLLFIAAAFQPCISQEQTIQVKPIEVKVLVLNYDPVVPGNWGQRLHEVCKWQDPRELSRQYAADVAEVSHGFIRYREVLWRVTGSEYEELLFTVFALHAVGILLEHLVI